MQRKHPPRLDDIIMLLAWISGCIGRLEIIEFGNHNLGKFRKLGMLKNGIPSEAALCRTTLAFVFAPKKRYKYVG